MDVTAMVNEIAAAGFDDTATLARIAPLLDLEHKRICAMAAWPFTETTLTWTPTIVAVDVPVPNAPTGIQFARVCELPLYSQTLSYLRRDIMRKQYGGGFRTYTDLPRHYYIYGGLFYVWPNIPIGSSLQIAFDYHRKPITLTAGVTEAQILLPPEFHGMLMDRVMARLSRTEGDLTDGTTYDARADSQMSELYATFDVNMDSPDPIIYIPEDDWMQ